MPTPRSHPLRADAARNRARILDTARELYAERGLEVTVDDVAERAAVGVATVYRRFPDRDALVEALFTDLMEAQADLALRCLDDPDPQRSFVGFLESVCEVLASDKGLRQVLLSDVYGHEGVARARRRLIPLAEHLLHRAQEAGVVRADLVGSDLPVLFLAIGAVAELAGTVSPRLWRRTFDLVVEGLRPRPERPFSVEGLTAAELDTVVASYRPTVSTRT